MVRERTRPLAALGSGKTWRQTGITPKVHVMAPPPSVDDDDDDEELEPSSFSQPPRHPDPYPYTGRPVRAKLGSEIRTGESEEARHHASLMRMTPAMTDQLNFAKKHLATFSPWEAKFISSLVEFVGKSQGMTPKQWQKLSEILNK